MSLNPSPSVLGTNLRVLRAVRGISQGNLALRAGMSQSAISKIEQALAQRLDKGALPLTSAPSRSLR